MKPKTTQEKREFLKMLASGKVKPEALAKPIHEVWRQNSVDKNLFVRNETGEKLTHDEMMVRSKRLSNVPGYFIVVTRGKREHSHESLIK